MSTKKTVIYKFLIFIYHLLPTTTEKCPGTSKENLLTTITRERGLHAEISNRDLVVLTEPVVRPRFEIFR